MRLTPEQVEIASLLHPAADVLVLQAIEKDSVANVIVELMLHVFDELERGLYG